MPNKTPTLKRAGAAAIVAHLNKLRGVHVGAIKAIQRKRSWKASEQAMAIAERRIALAEIEELQNALREDYELSN